MNDDEAYRYDPNGNRLSANGGTYTVGSNNQIASDGTWNYQYDHEGNLVQRTLISDSNVFTIYTWDYRNRLSNVENHFYVADVYGDGSGGGYPAVTVSYAYDAFDRLVYRYRHTSVNGDTTTNDDEYAQAYVYDPSAPGEMILSYNGSYLGNFADGVPIRYLWAPAVDMLLATDDPNSYMSPAWALTDQLNTVQGLLVKSGSTTTLYSTEQYNAFGAFDHQDDDQTKVYRGDPTGLRFTGRIYDYDSGLQYNNVNGGGRWYISSLGVWASEDSLGFAGDPSNLRRYCDNSPTNGIDPSGLRPDAPPGENPFGTRHYPPPPPRPITGATRGFWKSWWENLGWGASEPNIDNGCVKAGKVVGWTAILVGTGGIIIEVAGGTTACAAGGTTVAETGATTGVFSMTETYLFDNYILNLFKWRASLIIGLDQAIADGNGDKIDELVTLIREAEQTIIEANGPPIF